MFMMLPVLSMAHEGATGMVKDRMEAMKEVGAATKVLGQMHRHGPIDLKSADQAVSRIEAIAEKVPQLFKMRDMTPPTEALPKIWESPSEFIRLNDEMRGAAVQIRVAGDDVAAFSDAFRALGQTCQACHKSYRQPQ